MSLIATLDDICEVFDEFEKSGDTPIRFKFDDLWLELSAIHSEPDGTVTFSLEESDEEPPPRASIHWGGDGI